MTEHSINELIEHDLTFVDAVNYQRLVVVLREARDVLGDIQALVDTQAEDEGLWFVAENAAEGYLQAQLRKLHTAIEAAPLLKKWDKHE